MKRSSLLFLLAFAANARVEAAPPPVPSFSQLVTGNGFGFQVFDASAKEINQFLERPYRYLRPGTDPHGPGVERRNLAFDVYFGLRAGATGAWLREVNQTGVGYVNQSGIIQSTAAVAGVTAESYFFAPYGYPGNALLMVVHAVNTTSVPVAVDVFANPNFHLGTAANPYQPGADGERITTLNGAFTETGNGGGAMLYAPLGGFDRADCSGTGYARVKMGLDLLGTPQSCAADDVTVVLQKSLGTLAPGQSGWWGLALAFVSDPLQLAPAQSALATFAGGRAADRLLADAEAEWEGWRKPPPPGVSDVERRVFRQAEATLRMAQVLEPWSDAPKQKSYGMILASLPPGQWHVGWVRDATFATVALARLGHFAEAKRALQFFLDAEAGDYQSYVGAPYRISVTRYFGNGHEESDWNADGPNIEFDGFGLYLWAARTYVDASGDLAWLDEKTHAGEANYSLLRDQIVAPLEHNLEAATGVISADTSIWESHWNQRKHYSFSSLASARGLCDFAALAAGHADGANALQAAHVGLSLPGEIRAHMLDGQLYLGGSIEGLQSGHYHDGAVLAGFEWDLFSQTDPMTAATLDGLAKLGVASGGYMRNDDGLSSYDSNEWIVIDLEAAGAFRKAGRIARADDLLAWVTAQGDANYDLLPELFNAFPSSGAVGSFAGAVPMVGFGAASYVLALLDRAGVASERRDCGGISAVDGGVDGGRAQPSSGCAFSSRAPIGSVSLAFLTIAALAFRKRTGSVRAGGGLSGQ